jgi:hypothetical protein
MASIAHQMRILEDNVERMETSTEVLDAMQKFSIIEPGDNVFDMGERIHAFGVLLKRFTLLIHTELAELHGRKT